MKNSFNIPDFAQDILNASIEGIEQLTNKLSLLLKTPVFLTDPHYQILATSSPPGEGKMETVLAIQQNELVNDTDAFNCNIMTDTSDFIGIGTSIKYEKKTIGYLFFVATNHTSRIENLADILIFSASLSGIQLQRNLVIRKEKMKFKENFLFDLLYGNMKEKADIIEYGKLWGWSLESPLTAMVFSLTDFNHIATDKELIQSFLYVIERTLIERNIKPITMKRQNQIIVILTLIEQDSNPIRNVLETIASIVLKQITTRHSDRQFACGIGKTYENPAEFFRSFQEAKVALELGLLLGIPIPFFTDLGLERILYKHNIQELKEYYDSILGELLRYDAENSADLMETLEVLTSNQFDMTATSTALFLHRNTLRYRIKKIEEILNLKLDDLNNRLNITAAFKIKQLRNV